MKVGYRTPSIKRSVSARTTGKINKTFKKATNPMYGKKGIGYINDPQKAIYNKVYNKTTTSAFSDKNTTSSNGTLQANYIKTSLSALLNQLNETAKIINSTTNSDTLFGRLDFLFECCDRLYPYEELGMTNSISVDEQKTEFYNKIPDIIDAFIQRCYDREYNNALSLKTEKGRQNRMIRFFNNISEELNHYGKQYITSQNAEKLNSLLNDHNLIDCKEINILSISNTTPLFKIKYKPKSENLKSENLEIGEEFKDKHNKKDAAAAGLGLIIHGIYFSPLIIVSIVCFIIGFNTIAIMTLIAFISILVITYRMLI